MCQAVHRYAKANNEYMNNYDKNIESSYLMHLDANNLYGWTMSQCLKKTFNLHKEFPVLPERNKTGKCNKLVCNIQGKGNYVVHIRVLKQAFNHGLILKKAHSNSI